MPDGRSGRTDPKPLAELMKLGSAPVRLWRDSEVGAILSHQLAAPVQFDLESLGPEAATRLQRVCGSREQPIRSFAELLLHPRPPVELLELAKQFAKACLSHPEGPLPEQVAKALYYGSIASALLRCGKRITELDDRQLAGGMEWLVVQSWMDERMRVLLKEALKHIRSGMNRVQ